MDYEEDIILDIMVKVRAKHTGRILKHQIIELAELQGFEPAITSSTIKFLKHAGRISEPIPGVYKILKSTVQQTFD